MSVECSGMTEKEQIEQQISARMPLDRFLQIHKRISDLRGEEDKRLKALAELQQAYIAAASEAQQESVKQLVATIREQSRADRNEIRSLKLEVIASIPWNEAAGLYNQWLNAK